MRAATCTMLGAVAYALTLGGGGARAQVPPSEERCKVIMTIIAGVIHEYHGQISADLISDLQRKVGTAGRCDGPDEYRVWPNTKDREALGRIRKLLSAWDICRRDPSREGCEAAALR